MAIKKHTIVTHTITNDDIWFNRCGESQLINCERAPDDPAYLPGIQASDATIVYDKLLHLIKTNDAAYFKRLLNSHFIYPGYISSYISNEYRSSEGYHKEISEIYMYRFNIEALLIDHFDKFKAIVTILKEKNNPELLMAFISSLKEAGLGKLLVWNADEQRSIDMQLSKLQHYGNQLQALHADETAYDKGVIAIEHARMLRETVYARKIIDNEDQETLFNNLEFKLDLIKQLHAKDNEFNKHRGLKYYLANVCSFLMTVGIANVVNYAITGHVFFCEQTTTQQKIAETHAAIGLDPEDDIRFH